MPLLVDDLKDNKLYRKKIFLPSDPKNKRKNAAIFLMTPDYTSSVKTMNSPFFINNGRYESYYIEKDISFILSEDHRLLENSDNVCITENNIAQYHRVTCDRVEELNKYGVPYGEDLVAFTAMVFLDSRNNLYGYIIMTNNGSNIYSIEAASYQMKLDLIEFAILLYDPKTVKISNEADRKLYSKYKFSNVKYTNDSLSIMVREDTTLNESMATAKLDVEIAVWQSQIKLTEIIIKHFNDDNWMSHMYKATKNKITKIPLKGYTESTEDSIDRWKSKLKDQKATLQFYLAVKEIDAKEAIDMSDILQEYIDWVDSLSCPKSLKLKIINEVIDSYNKTIKLYEYNLKRYRTLSDAQKRVENVAAIISKAMSIFGWINITPLGVVRSTLMKAILPKSQKKAVLSETELEAKIELYTKIVETLEEKKKEIEALDESYNLLETMILTESPIPPKSADKKGAYCAFPSEKWDGKSMDEDCTDITIEHAINNFLQTKYPDHEDTSTCCIFVLDTNNILHFIGQAKIESTDPIKYSWIRKVRTLKGFTMYESTTINESFIFSKDNLYINFDKFENGSSNICFVTGLSGSGKSTEAQKLAKKYNAEWIELDIFEHCGGFNEDNLKEAGMVFYDYLSSHKELWDRLSNHQVHGKELREEIIKFSKYMVKWCSSHKDTKYIIEGVQIYSLMEIDPLKSKPMVIINTSVLKSIARRLKRGWQNRKDEDSDWKNMLSELPQMIAWYIDSEKCFNAFKKELLSEDTLLEDKLSSKHMYFYHLAPKGMNGDLYSLQYLYDHKKYDLFDKYTDKYRFRIANDWRYYNKNPEDLTREEILSSLKKFRKEDSLDDIYFFKFPPYSNMGPHMDSILANKDIYAIDIEDPKVKAIIKDIYWGTDGSHSDSTVLDRQYYENISSDEYFSKYDDKAKMNFASLNHISIKFKDGYCPIRLLKKVKPGTILEAKLSSKDRKDLPDSAFGIPSERRYPMPDKSHVLSAIRMFNHVEAENEKTLAHNIKKKIREFGMEDEVNISSDNRFSKYYKPKVHEGYVVPYINDEASLTDLALQTENAITFLEGYNETLLEADAVHNAALRKILYSERIKNHKEVLLLYDQVRLDCPYIKYTFVNYERYLNRNLFIDWSYYTKAFFKNNILKYDKAVDLFFDFINRFLDDKRLDSLGYKKKTVFIPVDDWVPDSNGEYLNYKEHLNPISIIYRLVYRDLPKLRQGWGDKTFVFTGRNGYFKMNFSSFEKKDLPRFLQNIRTIVGNLPITDDTDEPDNSTGGIVNQVIDRLETNSDIKINNLTGATKASEEEIKSRINNAEISSDDAKKTPEEKLVDAIATTAASSSNADEVVQKMNSDDEIKKLVIALRNSDPDGVPITPTRAARMSKLNNEFYKKTIQDKTIEELLSSNKDMPLPEADIPIDSINEDWKHLRFVNHDRVYDLDADIVRCIEHFSNTTVPVSIVDISKEDTSTSEDWIDTWTVKCEDSYGKRFTLKFDIPKLRNSRSMRLRGNDKVVNGQLMNLPIIKTESNTCQMTSNYNKIFFSGYGTNTGKSYVVADRLIKALTKMMDEPVPGITIEYGNNSLVCGKYELPSDYVDIASMISKITYHNTHINAKYTLFFNQDELKELHGKLIKEDDDSLAIGIVESSNSKPTILYAKLDTPVSLQVYDILSPNEKFAEVYKTSAVSVRYTYSKASILNTNIPVAIIIGYHIGLINMLDRLGVEYAMSDKRPRYDKNTQDIIKLSDAYIVYDLNYDSSMLLNGLKECDMANYSLAEVNSKKMWVEVLDDFGGRLKADGLDMFYDLMMDPITKIACEKYELPTDFIDGLLYANMLLSDNKFNRHVDLKGNRFRTNEIIAGYTYKALCTSYTQYRRDLRAGRDAKMTIKQTAVIDLLFADNTFGDLSSLSDLLEYESLSATSFKGLSGMNSDRAYGLDKRTFDSSMINVLSLSTGFTSNTGITRQATIDMNIDSSRGYIKNNSTDDMSVTKTFCMTEALTPFGVTSDDPFRSAMTYIQTAKHGMRTKISDPLLITNGADEALPYLTSNTFTYKTKSAGRVKELTEDYMVIEYKDSVTEVVDLRERILKNSDGGMYIVLKLDTDLKEGSVFSGNEIIAYDKASYTKGVGPIKDNYAYDIGTFVKYAIMLTDEGYEDSCIQTEWIGDAMSSTVVISKEYTLPKDTNVHFIAKKGQAIQEGEPLLIFQNAFDEEDANALIKLLSDDDDDIVSELGRIPIYSKVTGIIKDIKILRTVEIDELSPSLKKIVTNYEKDVKKFNKVLEQYDPDKAKIADATYKLEPTGKLKNAADSVRIEFNLAYEDKFSVGDKAVCYSALKGVSKGKIPKGQEPYSSFRPEEKIHYIQSITGDMKRMVGSIIKIGAINKVMVELARQSCDIMGIKWKYFDEY